MNIEIIQATIDKKPVLANLLELYAYDFTEIWPFDIGADGLYGYEWLDAYWENPNRFPYLVYVDSKIAGFVFVQKGLPISNDKEVYDVVEFFVMRKYRHKNIGTTVALRVWQMFKGPWQVRVLIENTVAVKFWERAIAEFTGCKPTGVPVTAKGDDWLVFKFT